MSRTLGAAFVAVLALTSCTSVSPGDAEPSGSPSRRGSSAAAPADPAGPTDPDEIVRPAWTRRLALLTDPEVVGDTAVVVVRARDDEMDIVGLAVDDGAVRWRHPYSPGKVPSGYGLGVTTARDSTGRELVVFQRPGTGRRLAWRARMVAVDPATGRVVRRSEPVVVASRLQQCDDGVDVCLTVERYAQYEVRFVLTTGANEPIDDRSPSGGRSLGHELFDDGHRPDERIGRMTGGEVRWQRPVAEVFGAGYSSDAGWAFELDRAAGVYWGSFGWKPPGSGSTFEFTGAAGARVFVDTRQVVGFSARTGRRLWRLGRAVPYRSCRARGPATDSDEPVACYWRGAIDVRPKRWWIADGGLVGFDPATGRVRWRVSAGRTDLLRNDGMTPVARGRAVLTTRRGPVLVDLADGSTSRLGRRDLLLCQDEPSTTDYALAYGEEKARLGDALLAPCHADGSRADRVSRRAVELAGVPADDGTYLVARSGTLAAYRL